MKSAIGYLKVFIQINQRLQEQNILKPVEKFKWLKMFQVDKSV